MRRAVLAAWALCLVGLLSLGAKCPPWPPQPTPTPTPTPGPTPEPTPEPTPTPTPAQGYLDGSRLVVKEGDMRPVMWGSVALAVDRDIQARPSAWEDRGGRWCLVDKAAGIPAGFAGVAVQLAGSQIRAGQIRWADGALSDSLGVVRPGTDPVEVEEYHLYEYGGGCVATNEHSLVAVDWEGSASPPPAASCPDPKPPKGALTIKVKAHGGMQDATVQTFGYPLGCDYCAAIGMSPMADGTIRCGCPMRPDGHSERVACELYALGGAYRWETEPFGTSPVVNPENPAQAGCDGCARLRVCASDGSFCSDWVVP